MEKENTPLIPKSYTAKDSEQKWNAFWKEKKFFSADPTSNKPAYCIVIPPPNVTGVLHMGHALVQTLQDILIRWKRMSGFEALWVPGTDHAGIATQTVVERHLIHTTGKKRVDFPREEFLSHVWEWKEKSETRITEQLKSLGCSCDWSKQRFTMDQGNNRAVRTMFKKLYDEGLIYRGDYLVNWDTATQTALADDEVEYEERQSFLWHFTYPVKDSVKTIQIATTRPETMLGDTAVAVHPSDPRYKDLIGKTVIHPLTHQELVVIADPFVDPEFGTGAVKITPAHDPNDYEIGLKHNLLFITMMTPDGKVAPGYEGFSGLEMQKAREKVIEKMKELGHFVKEVPHTLRVGLSYRSKAVIEPFLSKQWFVRMEGFKKKLTDCIEDGRLKLVPPSWVNTWRHWIDNLRDWCISRQLWWGHRIPVWYNLNDPDHIICSDDEGIPEEVAKNPEQWRQDEDVLDTWFSSALWPFATLGWPENTAMLEKFYPNAVLVTGHDILFFWVARMVAMGEYAMKQIPFPETFLHGLIYGKSYWRNTEEGIAYVSQEERIAYDMGKPLDKGVFSKWEKMSKSKGNVIDPLLIGEEFGTDAMRMALASSPSQSRQIDLDRRRFEEWRNFANKMWNATRFVLLNIDDFSAKTLEQGINPTLTRLEDHWILSQLAKVIEQVEEHLCKYQFEHATNKAYHFFWNDFCSWYVEISKPYLFGKKGSEQERKTKQAILVITLNSCLRLIHPMAPFVTEELFQRLQKTVPIPPEVKSEDSLCEESLVALQTEACTVAPYPTSVHPSWIKTEAEEEFAKIVDWITAIRNIRGELGLQSNHPITVYLSGENSALIEKNRTIIESVIRLEKLLIKHAPSDLAFSSSTLVHGIHITVPLPQEMIAKEKKRLEKEKEKTAVQITKLKNQLNNAQFIERAPKPLVQQTQKQLQDLEAKLAEINTNSKK